MKSKETLKAFKEKKDAHNLNSTKFHHQGFQDDDDDSSRQFKRKFETTRGKFSTTKKRHLINRQPDLLTAGVVVR